LRGRSEALAVAVRGRGARSADRPGSDAARRPGPRRFAPATLPDRV